MFLGIRPEHLRLSGQDHYLLKGSVKFSEALGAETLVHIELDGGQMVTLRQSGSDPLPLSGSDCYLTCDQDKFSAFRASGERIALD
jgi:sn-glycerol 3-phosphate transport system ATP-binding protein